MTPQEQLQFDVNNLQTDLQDARQKVAALDIIITQLQMSVPPNDIASSTIIVNMKNAYAAAQAAVDALTPDLDAIRSDVSQVLAATPAQLPPGPTVVLNPQPMPPAAPPAVTPVVAPGGAAPANTFTPQATAAVGLGGLVVGLLGGWWFWGGGSRKRNPLGEAPRRHLRKKRKRKAS